MLKTQTLRNHALHIKCTRILYVLAIIKYIRNSPSKPENYAIKTGPTENGIILNMYP